MSVDCGFSVLFFPAITTGVVYEAFVEAAWTTSSAVRVLPICDGSQHSGRIFPVCRGLPTSFLSGRNSRLNNLFRFGLGQSFNRIPCEEALSLLGPVRWESDFGRLSADKSSMQRVLRNLSWFGIYSSDKLSTFRLQGMHARFVREPYQGRIRSSSAVHGVSGMFQSINQSIRGSVNQSIKGLINQSINQSRGQSINQASS